MITIKKAITFLILLILVAVAIFSAVKIKTYADDMNENNSILSEISDIVDQEDNFKGEEKSLDAASLREINPDTVGYLTVNGTDIKYPVVQGKDNDYYLSHNFKKDNNRAGWIFADYRNKFDGTDKNIVIYGHNMKNGSMFSSLKNVLTKNWQERKENMYITFVTENAESVYKVFSVYQIEAEDYYTTTAFNSKNFQIFVDNIKARSNKNFNVEVKNTDQILTLSTCADDDRYRMVLHAVKM